MGRRKRDYNTELLNRANFFAEKLLDFKFPFIVEYHDLSDPSIDSKRSLYTKELLRDKKGLFMPDNEDELDSWILISEDLINKPKCYLNDALIKELIRVKLWYLGFDYDENSRDFIDECKKLHISNEDDKEFIKSSKEYAYKLDIETLQKYEEMYQEYLKTA